MPLSEEVIVMIVSGNANDLSLYFDLMEFYKQNKTKLKKKLDISSSNDLLDFCMNRAWLGAVGPQNIPATGQIDYGNVCKLAYIFSNVMGKQMPDNIHARLIFGPNNEWVKKYIDYVKNLKYNWLGINLNKNNFRFHVLSVNGLTKRKILK